MWCSDHCRYCARIVRLFPSQKFTQSCILVLAFTITCVMAKSNEDTMLKSKLGMLLVVGWMMAGVLLFGVLVVCVMQRKAAKKLKQLHNEQAAYEDALTQAITAIQASNAAPPVSGVSSTRSSSRLGALANIIGGSLRMSTPLPAEQALAPAAADKAEPDRETDGGSMMTCNEMK